MTELYAQIEDYLSGALQGDERKRFEEALQSDAGLVAEVALYKEMAVALTPSKEDDLRANLSQLGEKHGGVEPAIRRRWWIVAALVVLAGLGWWWKSMQSTPQFTEPPVEKSAPPVPDAPSVPLQKPDQPLAEETGRQKPESAPLAANFQPNPRLEALLDNQFRGEAYQFRIVQPAAAARLKRKGSMVIFQLAGRLETTAASVKPPFRVLLFSNRPKDYADFRPVFLQNLAFEKKGSGFQFQLEQPLDLAAGLYYFLIEDQDSGMVYHAGKVKVL